MSRLHNPFRCTARDETSNPGAQSHRFLGTLCCTGCSVGIGSPSTIDIGRHSKSPDSAPPRAGALYYRTRPSYVSRARKLPPPTFFRWTIDMALKITSPSLIPPHYPSHTVHASQFFCFKKNNTSLSNETIVLIFFRGATLSDERWRCETCVGARTN